MTSVSAIERTIRMETDSLSVIAYKTAECLKGYKMRDVKFWLAGLVTLCYKVLKGTSVRLKALMRTLIRLVAGLQFALIFPAALFLTSVLVATGHQQQYDLGLFAHEIVNWYSGRMWTLWLLLIALPFVVFVTGCARIRAVTDVPA
jgi:hypothetical protein